MNRLKSLAINTSDRLLLSRIDLYSPFLRLTVVTSLVEARRKIPPGGGRIFGVKERIHQFTRHQNKSLRKNRHQDINYKDF